MIAPRLRQSARITRVLRGCALLLGLLPGAGSAQDMPVPVPLQVSVFNRIWSYDRAHVGRLEGELVIGVVFQERYRNSLLAREAFEAALREQLPTGVRLRLVAMEFDGTDDLGDRLRREGVEILYVTPLRAVDVRAISGLTGRLGILSCTGVPDYVQQGVSVGVGQSDGRPEIMVNLERAQAEGADFRSQLLKLVRLVRNGP